MRRVVTTVLALGFMAVMAVLLDVATAPPASAHAALATTTPGDGARLTEAPNEVTLAFTEEVSLDAGYARVLGADGARVDTGTPSVTGAEVRIPLAADLPEASYVVTYRVLSADSHPIAGAYAFVVGQGELVPATDVDVAGQGGRSVAIALVAARWLGFAGVALGIGIPVFLSVGWQGGWSDPAMRRLTVIGLLGVVGAGLSTFALQGAYAAGRGLGSVADPDLLSATASSTFGRVVQVRTALAALMAVLVTSAWRGGRSPRRGVVAVGALVAVGMVVTFAAVGHPAAGPVPWLAVTVASVHVAAMAVWAGGLVGLLAGALRSDVPYLAQATAVTRFSRVAMAAVVALIATGVLQSVREVGAPSALVSTAYGWVLIGKVALVLVLLAVAASSRAWVLRHHGPVPSLTKELALAAATVGVRPPAGSDRAPAAPDDRLPPSAAQQRALRRSVLIEAALVAVVLALSAVLVGTPPAKASAAQPVSVTLPLQDAGGSAGLGQVQLAIAPATTGVNTLDLYLFDEAGRLSQAQDLRVSLTSAAQEIGPLPVDLQPAGPGHSVSEGMSIPTRGTWTLTVTVRLDEFTATTAATDFEVR
ncbi:Copper resistance protein CopC [Modestobacter italicus]|uniref:Copper resistance protein CopC n=1 Tax=Modestobacter italicus (strain DSM 44449 / CECT 9708 / BC 501) TaxID=2732864 RepID=I4EVH9_MODI5|nr:copper resistance protein CopC [Modestobacter marinus]CCH87392.1 Copper resistance protein CopC [Modestobacter marinus]